MIEQIGAVASFFLGLAIGRRGGPLWLAVVAGIGCGLLAAVGGHFLGV